MKSGGGSVKGGTFERKICKILSKWILGQDYEGENILRRSSLSGGSHTNSKKAGKNHYKDQSGDICAASPLANDFIKLITLELKHRAKVDAHSLIFDHAPKTENLLFWWRKHLDLAADVKKLPLLIVRQNRMIDLLLVPTDVAEALEFNFCDVNSLGDFPLHNCRVVSFDEFLEKVSYETFMRISKSYLILER